MARNNDVFSIIPIQNDNAIIAAGQPKSALTVNQVGIFDYETNLSIDAGAAATTRNFYIAMAVDRDGDGNVDDYVMSAGTHIQKNNVVGYTTRCYTPGQNQIIDIQNFTANCDTQYSLKIEMNNDEKYMNYGFNQLTKTFTVKTSCCDGCEDCPSGDCVELAQLLIADINADEDGLVVASAVANTGSVEVTAAPTGNGNVTVTIDGVDFVVALLGADDAAGAATKIAAVVNASANYNATAVGAFVYITTTSGAALSAALTVAFVDTDTTNATATTTNISTTTITDFTVFAQQNPGVCPSLRLTSQSAAVKQYCNINTQYYHIRDTNLKVSFVRGNFHALGFECNGEIATVQDAVYPEGAGYDLAQIEYKAGGWTGNPGPYRAGEMKGLEFAPFSNLVDKNETYNKIDITYDLESSSGWLDYKNNLNVSIVYPCGNDTFGASIAAVLDALMSGFDPKANDLAACDCNLNLTQDKAANVDGIG